MKDESRSTCTRHPFSFIVVTANIRWSLMKSPCSPTKRGRVAITTIASVLCRRPERFTAHWLLLAPSVERLYRCAPFQSYPGVRSFCLRVSPPVGDCPFGDAGACILLRPAFSPERPFVCIHFCHALIVVPSTLYELPHQSASRIWF